MLNIGCNNNLHHIKHEVYIVKDYQNANYFVPNSTNLKANCEKITTRVTKFQQELTPLRNFNGLKTQCESQNMTCDQLNFNGVVSTKEGWGNLRMPLFTLMQWSELYPQIPIMINTEFYEIEHFNGWPHLMPCTNIYGFAKATDGTIIGNNSANFPFDYFVINKANETSHITLIKNQDLTDDIRANANAILNGLLLVKNGKYVYQSKNPANNPEFKHIGRCGGRHGRTMVGFKNNDMLIFHISNKDQTNAATCYEAARLAIEIYGVTDLFNFDGGGSTGVLARIPKTDKILVQTSPSDRQGHRPIPSVLGITPRSMRQFLIPRGQKLETTETERGGSTNDSDSDPRDISTNDFFSTGLVD